MPIVLQYQMPSLLPSFPRLDSSKPPESKQESRTDSFLSMLLQFLGSLSGAIVLGFSRQKHNPHDECNRLKSNHPKEKLLRPVHSLVNQDNLKLTKDSGLCLLLCSSLVMLIPGESASLFPLPSLLSLSLVFRVLCQREVISHVCKTDDR